MRTFSPLFLLSSALLFAGKPAPAPTYSWTVLLVNGGNIMGGSELTSVGLAGSIGCTPTNTLDGLCHELGESSGWIYTPSDALVNGQVRDAGALFYPGYPREFSISMLLSASAAHRHVQFGSFPSAGYATRGTTSTSFRSLTITRQPALNCFVDFAAAPNTPLFDTCVLRDFLTMGGDHPQPGYAEVRFSFVGPGLLIDAPPSTSYWPATLIIEDRYSSGDEAGPCNLNKANLAGFDYPNTVPAGLTDVSAVPGTFMRRVSRDAWKVVVQSDFSGENPFRPGVTDDLTASCFEFPTKNTEIIWQNSGKPAMNATFYFIRKQQ